MGEFVTFHDALLYIGADTDNLRPGGWLNDSCINFMLRYLEHEVLPQQLAAEALSKMLFVDSSVLSCLMLSIDEPDELEQLAQGLDIASKSLIFAPVNDNTDFKSGSHHWSLMVISVSGARAHYLHFDSSSGYNKAAAEMAAQQFHALLGVEGAAKLVHVGDSPQQDNGYDCGMYCALAAAEIARYAGYGTAPEAAPLCLTETDAPALAARLRQVLTPAVVTQERASILGFAEGLPRQMLE